MIHDPQKSCMLYFIEKRKRMIYGEKPNESNFKLETNPNIDKKEIIFITKPTSIIINKLITNSDENLIVRSNTLLDNILSTPIKKFKEGLNDIKDLSFIYTYLILKEKPFLDENFITAMVVSDYFLYTNGYILKQSKADLNYIYSLREIYLGSNDPNEKVFISKYLKENLASI